MLCVGDLMLDEFVYGEVSRISPEAPAPVIAVQRSETNIGGAGNVARNIASLGGRCIFAGLIGEDEAGAKLKAALAKEERIEAVLVSDSGRPTTRKVRFVSEHFSTHMLRADWELAQPAAAGIEQKLIDAILPLLPRADIVLLSDYAKGVLTARVIRNVIDAARKLGKRGDRRSQERQFRDLSRRDAAHAQSQGIRGSHPQPCRLRHQHCGCRAGRDVSGRLRGHAGDAKRAWHDAGGSRRCDDPCSGASGESARRFRCGRYGRRRAGADARGESRLGDRAADGECRGRGRGRQEGHRDGYAGRVAAQDPAACLAGRRRKDRSRRRRPRTSIWRIGASRACASASPMAVSTFCIPATSRC